MDNICELFDELFLLIIEHLSDHDKVKFMTTCSRLYYFIDKVYYENIYDYKKIYHLGFVEKFKRIRFHAVDKSIPSVITDLTLDGQFTGSLENCDFPRLTYIKLSQSQYDTNKNYISSNIEIDIPNPFKNFLIKFDMEKLFDRNNYYYYSGTYWGHNSWYINRSIVEPTMESIWSRLYPYNSGYLDIVKYLPESPEPEIQDNFRPIFSTDTNNNKPDNKPQINKSRSQKNSTNFIIRKRLCQIIINVLKIS